MILVNGFNIGRLLQPGLASPPNISIPQGWNNHGRMAAWDGGFPASGGGTKFLPRTFLQQTLAAAIIGDTDRNWAAGTTNVRLSFTSKVTDASLTNGNPATGHTISLNGVSQTTNYISGSGTGQWILQIPVIVKSTDAVTYAYSQSAGNSLNPLNSVELPTVSGIAVNNLLTKRIRFTLYGSNGSPLANTAVKVATAIYAGGVASTYNWMDDEPNVFAGTYTTSAAGLVDFQYTGAQATGGTVYLIVIQPDSSPSESLIWPFTVL